MSAEKIKKQAQAAVDDASTTARDELEALKNQLEHFLSAHVVPPLSDAANSAVSNAREIDPDSFDSRSCRAKRKVP